MTGERAAERRRRRFARRDHGFRLEDDDRGCVVPVLRVELLQRLVDASLAWLLVLLATALGHFGLGLEIAGGAIGLRRRLDAGQRRDLRPTGGAVLQHRAVA